MSFVAGPDTGNVWSNKPALQRKRLNTTIWTRLRIIIRAYAAKGVCELQSVTVITTNSTSDLRLGPIIVSLLSFEVRRGNLVILDIILPAAKAKLTRSDDLTGTRTTRTRTMFITNAVRPGCKQKSY